MQIEWGNQTFYMGSFLKDNLDVLVNGVLTKNTSAVFILDGRSGLGKTTLCSQCGCYIHNKIKDYMKEKTPKFSLDNFAYTPEDFIEKLKNATKGTIVVLDESMILSNRSSMSEMNRAVVIMMSMIRSKQIFVIFNINSIFDMDRNVPLHRADFLLHLYAENDKFASRGRYMAFSAAKGKLKRLYIMGKKYYDYSKVKSNFHDRFSSFFPFNQDEYEKRKQEAIISYFGDARTSNQSPRAIKHRNNLIRYFYEKNKLSMEELAEIASCSPTIVSNAVNMKQ